MLIGSPPATLRHLVVQCRTKAPLRRGPRRVLDLGCGTGMSGQALAATGLGATVVGVDISPASLEIARSKGMYEETLTCNLDEVLPFEVRQPWWEGGGLLKFGSIPLMSLDSCHN